MKKWIPALIVGSCVLTVLAGLRQPPTKNGPDLISFGKLPSFYRGRVMPMDSIARTSLLMISGTQVLRTPTGEKSAIEWLADVLWDPQKTIGDPLFEIDDPDVLGLMTIEQTKRRRFSFQEIQPFMGEIDKQAAHADGLDVSQRTRFHNSILLLQNRVVLYQELGWASLGQTLMLGMPSSEFPGWGMPYITMGNAYRKGDAARFNAALEECAGNLSQSVSKKTRLAGYEAFLNHVEPFYKSMIIYVLAFLLVSFSFLGARQSLVRAGFGLMSLAFVLHTLGLVSRIVIQGRPPVTNLYSSAVFVGWAAALLGLGLEWIYRKGIGTLVTSIIGFLTLIVAHHLALQGDTMEMLQAVLDSNFWLTTHVVTIMIGYSSTFIAGFLAMGYLFRRAFSRNPDIRGEEALETMVYGVICFAAFFSFVGTVLGGVWADQSWGRFWGWDPKENGALLIVLWNVFILHAWNLPKIKPVSIMMMAVFGNVITALCWFGVNMLGIGLHSYGFMDKALLWLVVFIVTQLAVLSLGFFPSRQGAGVPSTTPNSSDKPRGRK